MHNLQGDIVAILDSNGTAVVQYKYDAWGRQIGCDVEAGNSNATALSTLNPFRYRGYVYDEETELYYLRSRYYCPERFRFVNADIVYTWNLFAFVANNPIYYCDEDGYAMYTAFEDCGFGNPMASLTGGVGGGGGAGWHTYTYAGVMQNAMDDEGRAKIVDSALDDLSLAVIRIGIGYFTAKLVIGIGAVSSLLYPAAPWMLSTPVSLLTLMGGESLATYIEDDLRPDHRLGGEKYISTDAEYTANQMTGAIGLVVPYGTGIVKTLIRSAIKFVARPLFRKLTEWADTSD